MSARRRPAPADDTAAGIARVEGYLLAQAEISTARREAEAFAGKLPWLTTAQREDVTLRYAEERLALSRSRLEAVSARCEELRGEYSARYRGLRQRLVCVCVAFLLGCLCVCSAVCALLLDSIG